MRLFTKVHFRVDLSTEIAERVLVVGSDPHLGAWEVKNAHELMTTDELHPSWFSPEPVYLPLKVPVVYKYVIVDSEMKVVSWEQIEGNRTIVPTGMDMTVEDDDGRYRQQTRSEETLLGEDQQGSLLQSEADKVERVEREAKDRVAGLHEQEEEPEIDENDTLVICAFELPVKVSRNSQLPEGFQIHPAKSALLPSLHKLRGRTKLPVKFVGYPGICVESEKEMLQIERLLEQHDCIPVFPPHDQLTMFLQFCHRFLWPLFHNVVQLDTRKQEPFNSELWCCYQSINRLWADVLLRTAHESDLIWVHDFHLLLLPLHITRRFRRANVGLFLHVPFPSSEVFRCLPIREEILRGMLCADLIGFHFFEYARHFLVACKRLLGLQHHFRLGGFLGIEYSGRNVVVRIGHVHIQAEDILAELSTPPHQQIILEKANAIRAKFEGRYIFASVDRCDRLAGLLLKIRAFDYFLNNYSYAQGQAVLIQYAYPSISYWDDVGEMRQELKDLVDRLNSAFEEEHDGNGRQQLEGEKREEGKKATAKPIELHVSEIDSIDKLALFYAADCLLDTSIKDGLNLNPFEFICCHHDRPANIILSEFTGCSRALSSAHRCNPWKSENVAEQMDLCMRSTEDVIRDAFLRDQNYVLHNSTLKWAEEFIIDLRRARKPEDMVFLPCGFGNTFRVMGMDSHFRFLDTNSVIAALKPSRNRVFFFDYEGTLAPDKRRITAVYGAEALFSQGTPPSSLVKSLLEELISDPRNVVVILSGRDTCLLEKWFGDVPGIGLCGEHGFRYKVPVITGDQWQSMLPAPSLESTNIETWKQIAMELMMQYVKRTQGSFVENKGSALVFQYRDADPDFGSMQAKELSNYLSEMLFGYPVTVVSGKGYVEAKLRGINKGNAVSRMLKQITAIRGEVDFILCMGDDRSDEDMFGVIAPLTQEDHKHQRSQHLKETAGVSPSPTERSLCGGCKGSVVAGLSGLGVAAEEIGASLIPEGGRRVSTSDSAGGFRSGLLNRSMSGFVAPHEKAPSPRDQDAFTIERFFTCTVGKKPTKAR
eukprot:GHVS01089405.1.p1 GENE.GHVS01089405.1~~GHVS01089405.1.p1  ORF type:complete len:1047 (-),score=173.86 GHVS01089405.1:125-3265(-)